MDSRIFGLWLRGIRSLPLAPSAHARALSLLDQKNAFLLNSSGGSLAFDLLSPKSGLWRGTVLDHPFGWPMVEAKTQEPLPALFVISDD